MRALLLLLLVCGAVASAAAADSKAAILAQVHAYETTQNNMDAEATANLFSANAEAYLPAGSGSPSAVGKAAIQQAYASMFGSLEFLRETVVSEISVNGPWAAASKLVQFSPKGAPLCAVQVVATNWFKFDNTTSPPSIDLFAAVWNVSAVNEALAPCAGSFADAAPDVGAPPPQLIAKQLQAYTMTQNNMQANASADLYAANGTARLPIGTNVAYGRDGIYQAYNGMFSGATSLREYPYGPFHINGNMAAYSKLFSITLRQPANCVVTLDVTCWSSWTNDLPPLIQEQDCVWDLDEFTQQVQQCQQQ